MINALLLIFYLFFEKENLEKINMKYKEMEEVQHLYYKYRRPGGVFSTQKEEDGPYMFTDVYRFIRRAFNLNGWMSTEDVKSKKDL